MNESLMPNVRAYATERQLQIAERLGSGKDGIVLVGKSMADPARVAIKAHRFTELYLREKAVYQRLEKMARITVLGSPFWASTYHSCSPPTTLCRFSK